MPDTSARPATEESTAGRANTVIAVLAFAGIVVSLMQTVVIPLVPKLPEFLDASETSAGWAVTATLLTAAISTPTAGRLGDMYGKRLMLLISLVLMVIGSILCALTDGVSLMIVGRALQGASSGVIALGISVMRDELPAERLGSGTALMSASLGIGGALGLPAAAFLAQQADWHVLFWVCGGFGAVAFVLVLSFIGESPIRTGGRFDAIGALGISTGLVCLLLGISQGSEWGWSSSWVLGLFGAAVVIFLLWGLWELRTSDPLVDLRSTARSQVVLTNIASVIFGFAMFAISLVIPRLVQNPEAAGTGLGGTILVAGLIMAPNGLCMMAMAPISGRISNRQGPKVTLMLGAAVVAIGYGLGIGMMSSVWQLVVFSSVIGAGVGLAYGAMPMLIMQAVPASETAAANSFNTLLRSLGTSTASAISTMILAELTVSVGPAEVPSGDGFRVVMTIGAGAAVIALIVASFLRGKKRDTTADQPTESTAEQPTRSVEPTESVVSSRNVRGTVTGTAGPGASMVTLVAHGRSGAVLATTTADSEGRYELADVPADPVTLVTTEHPAVHQTVRVGAGTATQHDIEIEAATAASAESGREPV